LGLLPLNAENPNKVEEQTLDVRQMVLLFLNSVIFVKIPLLIFGFRMAEEATTFNVVGFFCCVAFSLFTLLRFVLKQ